MKTKEQIVFEKIMSRKINPDIKPIIVHTRIHEKDLDNFNKAFFDALENNVNNQELEGNETGNELKGLK